MSMAAKLSDLADKMSGANLQADSQMDVPTTGMKDHHGPLPRGHHLATLI